MTNLENESNSLVADNERLKQELAKFATENEILRATSGSLGRSTSHEKYANGQRQHPEPTTTGPMKYTPTDFYATLVPAGQSNRRHRILYCEVTGEKLLDASATWDLIQEHELFKKGLVNIAEVSERLKGMAQCDGQGPAFKESLVRRAIEQSAAGHSSDELI